MVFTLAIYCLTLRGTDRTNVYEFQESIPRPGSLNWDREHLIYRERQELYRKRLAIPKAVGTNVPVAAGAYLAFDRSKLNVPTPASSGALGSFLRLLTYFILFILTGVFIIRRFAPHVLLDLNQRYNPLATSAGAERDFTAKVLADEEAFGKYLAAFRVGPSATPRVKSPEKYDPLVEFYARAKGILAAQRKLLAGFDQEAGSPARHKLLVNLISELVGLKEGAGVSGALPVWQVASALEGLLKRLAEKMSDVSPSALRTLGGGLDLLAELCVPEMKPDLLTDRPFKFLIVDDDLVSRKALSLSLKKAFSEPDVATDGPSALALTTWQVYDVIFLDVEMPGMDGFELCTKIRGTDTNRITPVVFVTNHSDFDARARSTLSGGNDLMGKPFLIFEVSVKALTLALQGRLLKRAEKPRPRPEPVTARTDLPLTPREGSPPIASSTYAMPPLLSLPSLSDKDGLAGTFLDRAAKNLGPLQELCSAILQAPDTEARQNLLAKGYLRLSSLLVRKDLKLAHPGYQMTIALEGLFKKLLEDSRNCTSSTLATLATAVDLLKDLCVPGMKTDLAVSPPIRILVVDDDPVARRIIVGALQAIFEKPEGVDGGEAALDLLAEKNFDVIFLDAIMPGMDGFEVCAKLRERVPEQVTPVVFVTSLDEFDARAKVNRNGGNDLMGKPFLASEIAVKALAFALRGRLQRLGKEFEPVNVQ